MAVLGGPLVAMTSWRGWCDHGGMGRPSELLFTWTKLAMYVDVHQHGGQDFCSTHMPSQGIPETRHETEHKTGLELPLKSRSSSTVSDWFQQAVDC